MLSQPLWASLKSSFLILFVQWFKLAQTSWLRNRNIFNKNKVLFILSWLVFASLIWTNLSITGKVGRLGFCLLGSTWAVLLDSGAVFPLSIVHVCSRCWSNHIFRVHSVSDALFLASRTGLHWIVLTHRVVSSIPIVQMGKPKAQLLHPLLRVLQKARREARFGLSFFWSRSLFAFLLPEEFHIHGPFIGRQTPLPPATSFLPTCSAPQLIFFKAQKEKERPGLSCIDRTKHPDWLFFWPNASASKV